MSTIPMRLVVAVLLAVAAGLAINYAVLQAGFLIPFAWLPPLLVVCFAALIVWAIGGGILVKRVWYWLFGAPWDAAGYIAKKSSKNQ